jgi:peptidoglycan hydrolase-like protein with peptidoglycan-binding domain
VAVALAAGCAVVEEPGQATATTVAPATTSTSSTTTSTSTTTTSTTLPPPPPALRPGDEGPEVLALQQQLTAWGYRAGEADGRYGSALASAVMAFQKHEGLQRDGVAGPQTVAAVAAGHLGAGPAAPGPGPRLEVDLARQIMFVTVEDGSVHIVNVSTGNNQRYQHPDGYSATAVTPVGEFAVGRKINAEEHAPLGTLYRPMYFKGGYAVHGSTSVPGYPASHGCVRVSYADEDWLFPQAPVGTTVILHGGGDQPAVDTENPAA